MNQPKRLTKKIPPKRPTKKTYKKDLQIRPTNKTNKKNKQKEPPNKTLRWDLKMRPTGILQKFDWSKETYINQMGPKQETSCVISQKRPIPIKRDLYQSKKTHINQMGPKQETSCVISLVNKTSEQDQTSKKDLLTFLRPDLKTGPTQETYQTSKQDFEFRP